MEEKGGELMKRDIPQALNEAQRRLIMCQTPREVIKRRQGRGGQTYDYVEIGYVIKQLNEITGHNWDFDVAWENVKDGEVIVKGRLIVHTPKGDLVKTQFGGAEVKKFTKGENAGKPMSLADDFKAAASDALKKCASLFGVALDVYSGEVNGGSPPHEVSTQEIPQTIPQELIEAVKAEFKRLGLSEEKIAEGLANYGVTRVEDLTPEQANIILANLRKKRTKK